MTHQVYQQRTVFPSFCASCVLLFVTCYTGNFSSLFHFLSNAFFCCIPNFLCLVYRNRLVHKIAMTQRIELLLCNVNFMIFLLNLFNTLSRGFESFHDTWVSFFREFGLLVPQVSLSSVTLRNLHLMADSSGTLCSSQIWCIFHFYLQSHTDYVCESLYCFISSGCRETLVDHVRNLSFSQESVGIYELVALRHLLFLGRMSFFKVDAIIALSSSKSGNLCCPVIDRDVTSSSLDLATSTSLIHSTLI